MYPGRCRATARSLRRRSRRRGFDRSCDCSSSRERAPLRLGGQNENRFRRRWGREGLQLAAGNLSGDGPPVACCHQLAVWRSSHVVRAQNSRGLAGQRRGASWRALSREAHVPFAGIPGGRFSVHGDRTVPVTPNSSVDLPSSERAFVGAMVSPLFCHVLPHRYRPSARAQSIDEVVVEGVAGAPAHSQTGASCARGRMRAEITRGISFPR